MLKNKKSDLNPHDDAVKLLWAEKINYEDASRQIREVLKKCYRNYVGVFEESKTRYTNMEKVFVHLTKWHANSIAARLPITSDAISVAPREEGDVGKASLVEKVLAWVMDRMSFDNTMRTITRYKTIMGTSVVACDWEYDRQTFYQAIGKNLLSPLVDGFKRMTGRKPKSRIVSKTLVKDRPRIRLVDILDVYTDPTADTLQTATSFIIRSVHTLSDIKNNKLFQNTDDLEGVYQIPMDTYNSTSLTKFSTKSSQEIRSEVPMVEVWERYGKIDLSWVTGKEDDKGKMTEGIITIGGPSANASVVLSIRLLPFKNGLRPFEEDRYDRIPNRWYGEGVAEKLLDVQREVNRVVNQRVENERVLQNPMFKVKQGSGVSTKDLISRTGGAIIVNSMDDIEPLPIPDIRQSSFEEEQVLYQLAQNITGAFDVTRGAEQAASKKATASILENQNAGNLFNDLKNETNDFLRRLFADHIIPYMTQFMSGETVIRVTGTPQELSGIDQMLGNSPEIGKQLGRYRFISIGDMGDLEAQYDLIVDVDESMPTNKAVQAKQLLEGIAIGGKIPGIQPALIYEMYKDWLELQGFSGDKFDKIMEQQSMPQPMGAGMPQGVPQMSAPTEMGMTQQANNSALPVGGNFGQV